MPIPVNITPPPARPRGLLLDAANEIPADAYLGRNGETRWPLEGVTWNQIDYGRPEADAAGCDVEYDKEALLMVDWVGPQPAFLLWKSLQCAANSGVLDLLERDIRYSLNELRSAAFAAELETAAASGGVGLIGNVTYAPTVVTTAASSLPVAMLGLEGFLATELNGAVGMIHLTAGLLSAAVAADLVSWTGGRFETPTGHIVVGDAGHGGQATPQGAAAPGPGEAWIYATVPVWYDETEVKEITSSYDGGSQFDFTRNIDRPMAERYGILVFDPSVIGAGLVTLAAGIDGGGA